MNDEIANAAETIERLAREAEHLKIENEALKAEIEKLKAENETLKSAKKHNIQHSGRCKVRFKGFTPFSFRQFRNLMNLTKPPKNVYNDIQQKGGENNVG